MPFTTIIDASTLHDHLDDPAWLIIDCRHSLADYALGHRLYEEAHIPGAFFADVERDLAGLKSGTNGRHPLPEPERFAAFLRALGANATTQIIAYDAGADMFAARLWFLSRWIGHENIAVLDGGFAAWKTAGFPVSSELPRQRMNGDLRLDLDTALALDAARLEPLVGDDRYAIIDARAPERFAGETEPLDPVAGHILGAKNRVFKLNYTDAGTMKSAAELRAEYEAFATPGNCIVHSCGSGVSAAVNMLAMEIAGLHGSRIYAGGWSEWCSDPSRPMVTKPKSA